MIAERRKQEAVDNSVKQKAKSKKLKVKSLKQKAECRKPRTTRPWLMP